MQPRIRLAFWAASPLWWLMSSFSSTSTPKSFLAGPLSLLEVPVFFLIDYRNLLLRFKRLKVDLHLTCLPCSPFTVTAEKQASFIIQSISTLVSEVDQMDHFLQMSFSFHLQEGVTFSEINISSLDVSNLVKRIFGFWIRWPQALPQCLQLEVKTSMFRGLVGVCSCWYA